MNTQKRIHADFDILINIPLNFEWRRIWIECRTKCSIGERPDEKNPSKRFVAVHRTQFDIFLSFRIEMACEEESAHAHIDSIETFSWVNDNPIA